MKKLLLGSWAVLTFVCAVPAQKSFSDRTFGFSMREPTNWISISRAELNENLTKFDLDDSALEKILKDGEGSILLAGYHKYDPKTTPGLIPTIQIRARSKGSANFESFKKSIVKSVEASAQFFEGFELDGQPQVVEVAKIKTILVTSKFVMKSKKGQILKVRSRMYAIPLEKYFLQLNFTDGYEGDDCSAEFDELVSTIKIGRFR